MKWPARLFHVKAQGPRSAFDLYYRSYFRDFAFLLFSVFLFPWRLLYSSLVPIPYLFLGPAYLPRAQWCLGHLVYPTVRSTHRRNRKPGDHIWNTQDNSVGRRYLKIREEGVSYITDDSLLTGELSRVPETDLAQLRFRSELFTYPEGDETWRLMKMKAMSWRCFRSSNAYIDLVVEQRGVF